MPSSPRITQYFRSKLGTDSLSDVVLQDFASWGSISPIAEVYGEWSREYVDVPDKRPFSFRPVLTPSALSPSDEHILAARSTLLCDSVAVVIPDSINFAIRLLRLVVLLEAAIDADLVIVVPEGLTGRDDTYADAWLRETASDRPWGEDEKLEQAKRYVAGTEVAWNLDLCASFPGKFDLACLRPNQTYYIRDILQTSGGQLPSSMVTTHDKLRYLHRALSVEFPMLELPITDMIRLRKDGVFEAWTEAIGRGLERMESLDQDQLMDPRSVEIAIIKASLEDAVEQVRRQLNRSDVLRNSLCGSTGFALSAACGALGSMGGPVFGAGAAGAGFLGGALVEWLGGRPRTGERTFKRLIAQVFE